MSKQLTWRKTPELRFILDETVDTAARIGNAIASDAGRVANAQFDASNYNGLEE